VKLEYWHKDHLGSLMATSDHLGLATARYSYDPFGKRRMTSGTYDANGTLIVDWTTDTNKGTDRGYTGHEHLDDVGLIHMNGRIFDPTLGRFLQADPRIQDPTNLQNFNRYGYCFNNPLTCSDPSGYSFWTRIRSSVVRFAAAVADNTFCYGFCSAAVGAYYGSKSGGGIGAIIGAAQGYYGYQASLDYPLLNKTGSIIWANVGTQVVMNGAFGCASAMASSGSCASGAASGAIGTLGNAYGFQGSMLAGCVSGSISGAGCSQGAADNFGSYAISYIYSSAVYAASEISEGDKLAAAASDCVTTAVAACADGALRIVKSGEEKNGLRWAVYRRSDGTGPYFAAYDGTNPKDLRDVATDLANAVEIKTSQYDLATKMARDMKLEYQENIVFVGHSLGGGLASAAAAVTGLSAVTFNAAGLNSRYFAAGVDARIKAYYTRSDILSFLQDSILPSSAAGVRYPLAVNGVHQMSGVCASMGAICVK
jgi:RHS repeat-associated protein